MASYHHHHHHHHHHLHHLLILLIPSLLLHQASCGDAGDGGGGGGGGDAVKAPQVVWAVNAGGGAHTDSQGIRYQADPLDGKVGTASDYGRRLPIARVPPEDQDLYQTERWADASFSYSVPLARDGHYVIVLKFAEVYFLHSQAKVFDVRVNNHAVVSGLDIYERVGHSAAHDEAVAFSILRGRLSVGGEVSTYHGLLTIEFVKGDYDNPKICALYIIRGQVEDVPQLPPHPGLRPPSKADDDEEEEEEAAGDEADDEDDEEEEDFDVSDNDLLGGGGGGGGEDPASPDADGTGAPRKRQRSSSGRRAKRGDAAKAEARGGAEGGAGGGGGGGGGGGVGAGDRQRLKSGPRVPDPYAADNSSLMFPILVAFGVFIPTLFCLCRL